MPENARQHRPRMDPLVPCVPNGATPTATCLDASGAPPPRAGGRAPFHPAWGSWTSHGTRREVERDGSCNNRQPCRDARGPRDKAHTLDTGPRGARQTQVRRKSKWDPGGSLWGDGASRETESSGAGFGGSWR